VEHRLENREGDVAAASIDCRGLVVVGGGAEHQGTLPNSSSDSAHAHD